MTPDQAVAMISSQRSADRGLASREIAANPELIARAVIEAAPVLLLLLWCAVLLVAWLFYRTVEVPALRLGQRLASRRA